MGVSPEASTTRLSPANRLPIEVVEVIIPYPIYDTRSPRCTLTCYAWYIPTVAHLYHTLTTSIDTRDQKFGWPKPIWYMHTFGLPPFVKEFQFRGGDINKTSPKLFNCHILRQLSALTSVQALELGYLNIPKFVPRVKRYFRQSDLSL